PTTPLHSLSLLDALPIFERALRELEQELGLREVSGRLYQLDGQQPPERAVLTSGERRQAERTGDPAFPDRVRAHLAELRAARSSDRKSTRLNSSHVSISY